MVELLQELGEGWVRGQHRGSLSHGLHQCAESLGQAATLHLSFLSSKMEMMAQPSSTALSCCKDQKLMKAENDTPNVQLLMPTVPFQKIFLKKPQSQLSCFYSLLHVTI